MAKQIRWATVAVAVVAVLGTGCSVLDGGTRTSTERVSPTTAPAADGGSAVPGSAATADPAVTAPAATRLPPLTCPPVETLVQIIGEPLTPVPGEAGQAGCAYTVVQDRMDPGPLFLLFVGDARPDAPAPSVDDPAVAADARLGPDGFTTRSAGAGCVAKAAGIEVIASDLGAGSRCDQVVRVLLAVAEASNRPIG